MACSKGPDVSVQREPTAAIMLSTPTVFGRITNSTAAQPDQAWSHMRF